MLVTETEAANYLKVAPATLRDWRFRQRGPRHTKLGTGRSSPVRYRIADLEQFVEQGVRDAVA